MARPGCATIWGFGRLETQAHRVRMQDLPRRRFPMRSLCLLFADCRQRFELARGADREEQVEQLRKPTAAAALAAAP